MSEPIFIKCQNPFQPTCAEIAPHLKAYWTQPKQFAPQSLALIELHLLQEKCLSCLRKFNQICQQYNPPWKKRNKSRGKNG